MSNLQIDVTDDPWAEAAEDFITTWNRLEAGETVEPINRLLLPSWDALVKLLSAKRVELLNALRQEPAASIKALAERLGRDRKNVYQDVQALEQAGLIERDDTSRLIAPYASVGARLEFAA